MADITISKPVSFDHISSCLFINPAGTLFRVYCPFRVVCQIAYPPYRLGDWLIVTGIGATDDQRVLFQIDRQYWPHSFFSLYGR